MKLKTSKDGLAGEIRRVTKDGVVGLEGVQDILQSALRDGDVSRQEWQDLQTFWGERGDEVEITAHAQAYFRLMTRAAQGFSVTLDDLRPLANGKHQDALTEALTFAYKEFGAQFSRDAKRALSEHFGVRLQGTSSGSGSRLDDYQEAAADDGRISVRDVAVLYREAARDQRLTKKEAESLEDFLDRYGYRIDDDGDYRRTDDTIFDPAAQLFFQALGRGARGQTIRDRDVRPLLRVLAQQGMSEKDRTALYAGFKLVANRLDSDASDLLNRLFDLDD
jgi:hypothetical protein